MKKLKYFIFVFILLFGFNNSKVIAKEFDAKLYGCSKVDCSTGGYKVNDKWEHLKFEHGGVVLHFIADYSKYDKYQLPKCLDEGFIGWRAYVFKDGSDDTYVFCDDDGNKSDSSITNKDVTLVSECTSEHIFKNKFLINSDKYNEIYFYAMFKEGYQSSVISSTCSYSNSGDSGGGSSSGGVSGGSSSYDFSDGSKVQCGNIGKFHKKIPELTSWVITIVQVAVPVLLIILGMIDFIKALVSQKEDEIKQGQRIFIKRVITGVLIFFVVVIVKFVVSLVANSTDSKNFISCIDCFISNKCN